MANSPLLALPLVAAAQAQKHVTVNAGLMKLDALVQLAALDRDLTAPPGSPTEGAVYVVAASPTGAWTGWSNRLALYQDGAWSSIIPRAGWTCFCVDEAILLYFDGAAWVNLTAISNLAAQVVAAHGGKTGISVAEIELTCSASPVTATGAGIFPDRAIMLGVSSRVTQAITGTCTSWTCGISGDAAKFGSLLGKTLGSVNVGVIGPTAVYAATPVVLTATGGTFTGGKVRVTLHALTLLNATS